jgi:hypothetical protein
MVTHNLTLHYDRMMIILDPTLFARRPARKKVEVVNYPEGRFAVRFNGTTTLRRPLIPLFKGKHTANMSLQNPVPLR